MSWRTRRNGRPRAWLVGTQLAQLPGMQCGRSSESHTQGYHVTQHFAPRYQARGINVCIQTRMCGCSQRHHSELPEHGTNPNVHRLMEGGTASNAAAAGSKKGWGGRRCCDTDEPREPSVKKVGHEKTTGYMSSLT